MVPAPLEGILSWPDRRAIAGAVPAADFRYKPHYPAKSPLEDVLRLVTPGLDEFTSEKHAAELMQLLGGWSQSLMHSVTDIASIPRFVDDSIAFSALGTAREIPVHQSYGIQVLRRQFGTRNLTGKDGFAKEIKDYLHLFDKLETAQFEITRIEELASSVVQSDIRYEFVGTCKDKRREQRIGTWRTQWRQDISNGWVATQWSCDEEAISRARTRFFADVTAQALGRVDSYNKQLLRGTDYWRAVLDGASGINVYGNSGVAVGDFDGDGFDDIYVCQPSGLPNRLYQNRGDGTFEDFTEKAGVGVLDPTACALFADFENKGAQDLLVVCDGGPLLFVNQGNGRFSFKPEAFKFDRPPQGNFTHAGLADYDKDGRLDIYFCLYNYYLGLDQYHYPAPYFDARNGPPNFLMHNEGDATFRDQTRVAGLSVDNDRYSFACAWGDINGNGWSDLLVANDFGRSNLYRNNGNGTFTSISREAGVEDVGAGMSACWCDFDGDGSQDIYVGNMWSAAGQRVSADQRFHHADPTEIRALYRRHARGNSLYRNLGNGKFENKAEQDGVGQGRWSWSSDAWDFDHDGYPDLYVTNGYISGENAPDLGSFFWRQVVAKSPQTASSSANYELAWNAINELVRSNGSWAGYERNIFYMNNQDGTFSDISGVAGLDFPDDGRAFALADLDHDGRLEIVLKNRNAPQLRILRNTMTELGASMSFRLRGTKSNRDAIGAAVTLEGGGHRQTKYLQAGSGFLSQHSKELFFGIGNARSTVHATVRWPSGTVQTFGDLPANHRIELKEGSPTFTAIPVVASCWTDEQQYQNSKKPDELPNIDTWLIEPSPAPRVTLQDASGATWDLQSQRGKLVLMLFWTTASVFSIEQLRRLSDRHSYLSSTGLKIAAININENGDDGGLKSFSHSEDFPFPLLLSTPEMAGIYNIVYRYLFDLRRDLPIPISFLVNEEGMIVKIYQGELEPDGLLADLKSIPRSRSEREAKALPFKGKLHKGEFHRNAFTLGVAFFQRGYLDQAAESFRQVVARDPNDAEAYYNLGTLSLRRNSLAEARANLEHAVKLRPNYPEAWNNLGMLAAQEGRTSDAIQAFKQSLQLKPDYGVALVNLGNVYRKQRQFSSAQELLNRALQIEPNDPEVNYSIGMLYAQQEQVHEAEQFLKASVRLRPNYADALNNLGVVFVREQRYQDAEQQFRACIDAAPNYDQAYLNLARLYVIQDRKENAREVLQALLHHQPQHKLAQQALEMLN